MAETIDALRAEHRNMSQMLDLLERQVALFEAAAEPDYELMGQVVDYFRQFPDLYHHPKEELILQHLMKRSPQEAERLAGIEGEHETCSALLQIFTRLFVGVLMGMEVPREKFAHAARNFIENERRHMKGEEEGFFPMVVRHLTPEDWCEIDQRALQFKDPLSEPDSYFRLDLLREYLAAENS